MQIKPNLLVKKRLANTGGRRRAHQVESGWQTLFKIPAYAPEFKSVCWPNYIGLQRTRSRPIYR